MNISKTNKILNYIFMVIVLIIFLIPIFWLVVGSLKSNYEYSLVPPTLIPDEFMFSNYTTVWKQMKFGRAFFNSTFVSVTTTFLNVITGTMAGYAFSKRAFKGSNLILSTIIAFLIVPPSVLLLPTFFIINNINMTNSLWGLILPFAANAFTIFYMTNYISDVPNELIEAAEIDGMGDFKIFLKIVMPLIKPGMITVTIINFVGNWNSFIMPLVLITDSNKYTLPLKQNAMIAATDVNQWNLILASTILSILPVVLLFILTQKYFVDGVMEGAVKG